MIFQTVQSFEFSTIYTTRARQLCRLVLSYHLSLLSYWNSNWCQLCIINCRPVYCYKSHCKFMINYPFIRGDLPLSPWYGVYIYHNLVDLLVSFLSQCFGFYRKKFYITEDFLHKGLRYHNPLKHSKCISTNTRK